MTDQQASNDNGATPARKRPYFMVCGGSREVGGNAYLYGYGGTSHLSSETRWGLLDIGLFFDKYGYRLPNISFLLDRGIRLDFIAFTHTHLDHIGGFPYLWDLLGRPTLYARLSGTA